MRTETTVPSRKRDWAAQRQNGWLRRHAWGIVRVAIEIVAVTAGVYLLLERSTTLDQVFEALARIRWEWLVVAIGAGFGAIAALAWLQQRLLSVGGVRTGFWDMFQIVLASNALAISLPAGVAFAEGYAFHQYRRRGADGVIAAWTQMASGAWSVAALAGVVLAGIVIAGPEGPPFGFKILGLVVFTGALGAAVLFRYPHRLARGFVWLSKHLQRVAPARLTRLLERAEQEVTVMSVVHPSRRDWAAAAGFATLNWLGDVAVLALAFVAVSGQVPWRGILLAFGAAELLAQLPITPGGIGLVEGGLMLTLVAFGAHPATSAAAVVVFRGITFWLLLAAGWTSWSFLRLKARGGEGHGVVARLLAADIHKDDLVPSREAETPAIAPSSELEVLAVSTGPDGLVRIKGRGRGSDFFLLIGTGPEPPTCRTGCSAHTLRTSAGEATLVRPARDSSVGRMTWSSEDRWAVLTASLAAEPFVTLADEVEEAIRRRQAVGSTS